MKWHVFLVEWQFYHFCCGGKYMKLRQSCLRRWQVMMEFLQGKCGRAVFLSVAQSKKTSWWIPTWVCLKSVRETGDYIIIPESSTHRSVRMLWQQFYKACCGWHIQLMLSYSPTGNFSAMSKISIENRHRKHPQHLPLICQENLARGTKSS